ncbi:MAG: family 43 glycosylhydrolase [Clostridia bacterium]|nr:family 43 glycosylhydrolase [Clostridia bacterium]
MKKTGYVKKITAALLGVALAVTSFGATALAADATDTGVRVRDPFVLEHEGTYYMYGTGLAWGGYGCVYSADLKNWSDPVRVYSPQGACDGEGDWWAPECHEYQDNFYLFATYRSAATGKRGVAVFRSADPPGPFEIISDGHVTPKDHDAIDGTLYVDEKGQPWMVYVGEWTCNEDGVGDMMAAKLSDDLTRFVSEPVLLFRGTDAGWAKGKFTDGPFLYKTKTGRLLMLWSCTDRAGYAVGIAYSSNGRIDGKWRQQPRELYKGSKKNADGGHGMLFTAPDGTLTLAIHSPNSSTEDNPTTAVFVPVADIGDTLVTKDKDNLFVRLYYRFYFMFMKLAATFEKIC